MISSKRHSSKNFLYNTPLASLWIQSKGGQSEGRDSDTVGLRLEERFLDASSRELRCGDGEEMWDVNWNQEDQWEEFFLNDGKNLKVPSDTMGVMWFVMVGFVQNTRDT
jgi:hypothetical protein